MCQCIEIKNKALCQRSMIKMFITVDLTSSETSILFAISLNIKKFINK